MSSTCGSSSATVAAAQVSEFRVRFPPGLIEQRREGVDSRSSSSAPRGAVAVLGAPTTPLRVTDGMAYGRCEPCPGNLYHHEQPYPMCSRTVLTRQADRARQSGYVFGLGIETEFFFLPA